MGKRQQRKNILKTYRVIFYSGAIPNGLSFKEGQKQKVRAKNLTMAKRLAKLKFGKEVGIKVKLWR